VLLCPSIIKVLVIVVGVGVAEGVGVGDVVGVGEGDAVGAGEAVGVGERDAVGAGEGEAVGAGEGEGVGAEVGVGEDFGGGVEVGSGVGVGDGGSEVAVGLGVDRSLRLFTLTERCWEVRSSVGLDGVNWPPEADPSTACAVRMCIPLLTLVESHGILSSGPDAR